MQNCGLWTFQEAFDRTGRIINIIVAPMNPYDPPRLLNYLTAPHVCVWSAAAASCAIPGIFDPITLIVKEPDGRFRPENEWTRQGKPRRSSFSPNRLCFTSNILDIE
jgi:TAG lipase/steryl ester hydrolase/phospholipase A2/LPA acyltransferase